MEPAVQRNNRLPHIDLLKCLAISFVLIFHCTLYNPYVYTFMTKVALMRFFSRSILSSCVPLFFFVNGYLLLSRPTSLKKHTLKTLRLMMVTVFWILFLLLVLQPYYGEYFTWTTLLENCWQLKGGWNNQLWYMEALIGLYLLFPLIKSTFDHNRPGFYWFTAVMALLLLGSDSTDLGVTLYNLFVKKEFSLYYNDFPLFSMFNPFGFYISLSLTYFCLGGTAWALEEHLRKIPVLWRNLAACVGLILCCGALAIMGWRFSLYLGYTWDLVWNGYDTVFTFGTVLCLYLLCLNAKKDIALLRLISANTLGIYLIHDLFHKWLSPYTAPIPAMQTLTGTILHSAIVLALSLVACLVIKKIPLLKHLI